MWHHRPALSKPDANGREIKHTVEVEIQTLVGHRRIAHSRTDTLKLLGQEVGDGEAFKDGISPIELSDVLMSQFGSSFGQAVGQRLSHQMPIIVLTLEHAFKGFIHRNGKETNAVRLRRDEIGQAKKGRPLLTEKRKTRLAYHHIVGLSVAISQEKTEMALMTSRMDTQKTLSLLEELHRLSCTRTVGLWKLSQPCGATTIATMDVGDGGKAGRKAPGMKEISPINVRDDVGYRIMIRKQHAAASLIHLLHILTSHTHVVTDIRVVEERGRSQSQNLFNIRRQYRIWQVGSDNHEHTRP